ncbi:hypothetical protein, partial [Salipiger thiooxidans]|uniref:hypothetical protein n=2 Tax=Salipiger thiooxidans TaxID=282683 RepID=UPI001CFA9C37
IHRMNQSRPHISSDIINVKERERQKPDQCALSSGAPAFPCLSISYRIVRNRASFPRRRRSVLRPVSASTPPVEGLSTDYTRHPQAPFPIIRHLFFIREDMEGISKD